MTYENARSNCRSDRRAAVLAAIFASKEKVGSVGVRERSREGRAKLVEGIRRHLVPAGHGVGSESRQFRGGVARPPEAQNVAVILIAACLSNDIDNAPGGRPVLGREGVLQNRHLLYSDLWHIGEDRLAAPTIVA